MFVSSFTFIYSKSCFEALPPGHSNWLGCVAALSVAAAHDPGESQNEPWDLQKSWICCCLDWSKMENFISSNLIQSWFLVLIFILISSISL